MLNKSTKIECPMCHHRFGETEQGRRVYIELIIDGKKVVDGEF